VALGTALATRCPGRSRPDLGSTPPPWHKWSLGVPRELWACHTTVVEGHVPVEVIAELLVDRPHVDGIALPAMPIGSPGVWGEKDETWSPRRDPRLHLTSREVVSSITSVVECVTRSEAWEVGPDVGSASWQKPPG
jgi:hypothetical protein